MGKMNKHNTVLCAIKDPFDRSQNNNIGNDYKFINSSDDSRRTMSDTEPTDSMLCPRVSRCGCPLKPTPKQFQLPNATNADVGEGTSWFKQK